MTPAPIDDPELMARQIMCGFLFSRLFNLPLRVGGKEWRVPDGFLPDSDTWLPPLDGPTPSIKNSDDLAEAWGFERGPRGQIEAARRICWCLSRAERAVEKLGVELGLLEAQPPTFTHDRPDWLGPARTHAPDPQCPEPAVSEVSDGTVDHHARQTVKTAA